MEQKAAHTPGPWKFGKELTARSGEWLVSFDAGSKGRGIAIAETRAGSGNEEANAHLIAAAPQLLEALQTTAANLRSWKAANGGGIKTFDSWLEVVEEAIAKAKGGAA